MSLYDGLKDGINFAKNAGNSDVMQKLIDIQQQIVDIQTVNLELREENDSLKKRIETEKDLVVVGDFLCNKANPHNYGSFCQACWENNSKLIKIILEGSTIPRNKRYKCPSCKQYYTTPPSETEINDMLWS